MRFTSPILNAGFFAILSLPVAAGAIPASDVLAGWDFEALTGLPVTTSNYGPLPSDVGSGKITGFHGSTAPRPPSAAQSAMAVLAR